MSEQVMSPEFISDVIEHMNTDHVDSLQDYLRAFTSVNGGVNAKMTDLSVSGFELEYQSTAGATDRAWIPFGRAISRPEQVRGALVSMAKRARSHIEGADDI